MLDPADEQISRTAPKAPAPRKLFTKLDRRGIALAEAMVSGSESPLISVLMRMAPSEHDPHARRPLRQNEPLFLKEAARAVGLRYANAKFIARQKVFHDELNRRLMRLFGERLEAALRTCRSVLNVPPMTEEELERFNADRRGPKPSRVDLDDERYA